jgi:tRNA modification GTPase
MPPTGAVALLTSPGPAGIAVVRAHGPGVATFLDRHVQLGRSAAARLGTVGAVVRAALRDESGAAIDDVLISIHQAAPTGDIRVHLHGNPWLVRRCLDLLAACGLEPADAPADLWPTDDVLQAEAFALLPRVQTLAGARWLLRQPEQLRSEIQRLLTCTDLVEVRAAAAALVERGNVAEWFTQPLRVAIVGPPNAGKSTLVNALADRAACVVSPFPGTTRDWVEVPGEVGGFPVHWLDTAGLRTAADALEEAGMAQTRRVAAEADALLVVADASAPATTVVAWLDHVPRGKVAVLALNKADLCESWTIEQIENVLPTVWRPCAVPVSASQRSGLVTLTDTLLAKLGRTPERLTLPAAYTQRQTAVIRKVSCTNDLFSTREHLARVTGGG